MTSALKYLIDGVVKILPPPQRYLIEDLKTVITRLQKDHISDYSFLVAPIAKAYEGFLKDFFLQIGIIDKHAYNSDHFRVGKTLNPSLRYKRFSIFTKLSDIHDKGEELAEKLWTAWKLGRNEIFHYFPKNVKSLTRTEAEDRIILILQAITEAHRFLQTQHSQKYRSGL